RPTLEYSYPETIDVDLDWLLAHPEAPELHDAADEKTLKNARAMNDYVHQFYIFELTQQRPWRRDLIGDRLQATAPENAYVRYALGTTDAALDLFTREIARGSTHVLPHRA